MWRLGYEDFDGIDAECLEHHVRARSFWSDDFNATSGDRGSAAILGAGLSDEGSGCEVSPLDVTWSRWSLYFERLLRIDRLLQHCLIVTTIRSTPGPGSDHRALEVRVAILSTSVETVVASGRTAGSCRGRSLTPHSRVLAD